MVLGFLTFIQLFQKVVNCMIFVYNGSVTT